MMKAGKLTFAIIGMFILGAIGFWVMGALVEYRIGRPIPSGEQPAANGEPIAVLRQGARETIRTAETALRENRRSEAVTAMDAAMRATEVGKEASGDPQFKQAHEAIKHARLAIQNGSPERAQTILAQAEQELGGQKAAQPSTLPPIGERLPESDEILGARVLNAQGVRIGELEEIRDGRAVIVVGAPRDVFGFIDLPGGRRIEVPLESLVVGKGKDLGTTMVVLPTFSTSPGKTLSRR